MDTTVPNERRAAALLNLAPAQAEVLADLLKQAGFEVRAVQDLDAVHGHADRDELVVMPAGLLSAAVQRREAPGAGAADAKLRAIAAIVNGADLPAGPTDTAVPLTSREREIVDLLANGARVVTIARHLRLSAHTVRNHLKSALRKLNLKGQHELFEYWRRHA